MSYKITEDILGVVVPPNTERFVLQTRDSKGAWVDLRDDFYNRPLGSEDEQEAWMLASAGAREFKISVRVIQRREIWMEDTNEQ